MNSIALLYFHFKGGIVWGAIVQGAIVLDRLFITSDASTCIVRIVNWYYRSTWFCLASSNMVVKHVNCSAFFVSG